VPPAGVAPPAEQSAADYAIPPNLQIGDELRAMLSDPGFRDIALSIVPEDARGAFEQLVVQNSLSLQAESDA
jgi:hypothetical protein